MPDDAGENPKPSQTPESKGQAPNPKEAQSGGVNINTAGDAAIRGDAVGHDKIVATTTTAGGHIIQAEAGATIIVGATRAAPTAEDEAPAPGESPFKGLQYFDEADAELFFGREMLTAKLVGQLHKHRFLAVVGGSGSGKSSLVRAGLIPALKRGETLADGTLPPDGSINWLIYIITPSAHPLEELATALIPPSEPVKVITTFMDDLANDPRNLHFAVRRALGRVSAGKFVLIVDQFEELFTLCRSEVERKTFVDSLLYATAPDTDGTTIVVITLRADFYTHCAQFANLREALAKQQEYIGPLSATELRRAIEEPAKRGGWTFAPSLVSSLLRDVSNEPGALPLLSHALLETWKRRRGRTITHNGYAESGGVRGAIAKTAEAVFNQRLTPEQQIIARNIFLRLTELGKGTQDTCRRATLAELIPRPEDTLIVESILKILADARLITTSERTVEVAHEALIREWPKLREWLGQNREGLHLHRHFTEAALEWSILGRDPGELYRGLRLVRASEYAEEHSDELNTLEREFLNASRALQVSELEEARKRAQMEALRTIDAAITASLDLRVTLNILLDQITTNLRVDAASVLLLDTHTHTLEYTAGQGFRFNSIEHSRVQLGEGLAGQAALERRSLSIPNLSNSGETLIRAQLLVDEGFVSYHAAPLIAKGQVKGVLEIFHRVPFTPSQDWLDFLEVLAGQGAIAIDNTSLFNDLQRANIELALAYDATLEGWSRALDLRDKETEGHTQRVTEMTVRLAQAMGLTEEELVNVRRGALLHDIGKMGVPDSILLKPESLTNEEFEIMRRHPIYGYELLTPIAYLHAALDIPYCHHEKWDGTGFPRGLIGEAIPLAARIFAVADVWDALRSNRPYRGGWPEEKVREHIRSLAGTHFDPKVVEAFLRMEW